MDHLIGSKYESCSTADLCTRDHTESKHTWFRRCMFIGLLKNGSNVRIVKNPHTF